MSDRPTGTFFRRGLVSPDDVVDVFVYVVVLNLFAEFAPNVIAESFSLSLLTAVMLKLVLEVILLAKNRVRARLKAADTPAGKVGGALLLWLVVFGSKFVVLSLEDLVFGDKISLGGFVSVTLLILALLFSRAAVRQLLRSTPQAD